MTEAPLSMTFILEQLTAEEARKTSIEARGAAVITIGRHRGSVVRTNRNVTSRQYVPPSSAGDHLAVALWLFEVAVVLALLVNAAELQERPAVRFHRCQHLWHDSEATASTHISDPGQDALSRPASEPDWGHVLQRLWPRSCCGRFLAWAVMAMSQLAACVGRLLRR
jgi:hypothetical protein